MVDLLDDFAFLEELASQRHQFVGELLEFLDEDQTLVALFVQDLVLVDLNEIWFDLIRLDPVIDVEFLQDFAHSLVDLLHLSQNRLELFELRLLPLLPLLLLFLLLGKLELAQQLFLLSTLCARGQLLGEHLEVLLLVKHIDVFFVVGGHLVDLEAVLLLLLLVLLNILVGKVSESGGLSVFEF